MICSRERTGGDGVNVGSGGRGRHSTLPHDGNFNLNYGVQRTLVIEGKVGPPRRALICDVVNNLNSKPRDFVYGGE